MKLTFQHHHEFRRRSSFFDDYFSGLIAAHLQMLGEPLESGEVIIGE
jgi:hypothetical protein